MILENTKNIKNQIFNLNALIIKVYIKLTILNVSVLK